MCFEAIGTSCATKLSVAFLFSSIDVIKIHWWSFLHSFTIPIVSQQLWIIFWHNSFKIELNHLMAVRTLFFYVSRTFMSNMSTACYNCPRQYRSLISAHLSADLSASKGYRLTVMFLGRNRNSVCSRSGSVRLALLSVSLSISKKLFHKFFPPHFRSSWDIQKRKKSPSSCSCSFVSTRHAFDIIICEVACF